MPYVIVGDEAFPLRVNLMRPYPGRSMKVSRADAAKKSEMSLENRTKRIFNYRLSRARRVVENSFGIMAQKWRIFLVPIAADIEMVERIVQTCVCLHNFLLEKKYKHYANAATIKDVNLEGTAFAPLSKVTSHQRVSTSVRVDFADYFETEGVLDWQDDKIFI